MCGGVLLLPLVDGIYLLMSSYSGARGLGFNMAQALGECGAKAIVIMDVLQEPGDGAAAELHEMCGVPVQFYKVDIRDEKGVAEVISNVAETFGSIDVLVNSAGIAE
jgi:NAD(P)-dependent dehydrogenase (short-subunit alcohol dehydrogenase family)